MLTARSVGLKIGLLAATAIALGLAWPVMAQTPPPQSSPAAVPQAGAAGSPPNILILWGDDIGYWNISTYNQGMMGYKTPNIDRIAREGGFFTDYYGQQSCTAGRAAFITGQSPYRTGLLKVGLPGAKEGMQAEDPTLAELLKPHGYMTGQFGKNHLGDLDEHLPTMHGFDEFFGSLYHLNAEDEPEHPDYPKDPEFLKKFGPRGVLHSWANPDGTQRIENTGPLTKKRMETIDQEVTDAAIDFMKRAKGENKPFFLWWNSTRMHIWTRLKPESQGKTGFGIYPDGMVEHDGQVVFRAVSEVARDGGLHDHHVVAADVPLDKPVMRRLYAEAAGGLPVRVFHEAVEGLEAAVRYQYKATAGARDGSEIVRLHKPSRLPVGLLGQPTSQARIRSTRQHAQSLQDHRINRCLPTSL